MKERIKELLSLVDREKRILEKMVIADEKNDRYVFNKLSEIYKGIFTKTNAAISKLIEDKTYDYSFRYVATRIDEGIDKQKNVCNLITLLGLINTTQLNIVSRNVYKEESDYFSNELVLQIYDIYLWLVRESNFSKEFMNSFRNDALSKLVNSRAARLYFAGEYDEAAYISDPLNISEYEDRNKLGTVYASLMIGQVNLSNGFEMYDGTMDELEYETRKQMLEIEFAAISTILLRRRIIIPPNTMEYSDYTEEVIRNASDLADRFNRKEHKEKEQNPILLKEKS